MTENRSCSTCGYQYPPWYDFLLPCPDCRGVRQALEAFLKSKEEQWGGLSDENKLYWTEVFWSKSKKA